MALKQEVVIIDADGRDKGKVFVIHEFPARRIEKWGARAVLAIAKNGVSVDFDPATAGMAEFAELALRAIPKLDFADAEPLLDEMMQSFRIRPDKRHPEVERELVEDDIEEVATIWVLRKRWIQMHTGFSMPGAN